MSRTNKTPDLLEDFSDINQFRLVTLYLSRHLRIFVSVILLMILNVSLAMASPLILNYVVEIVDINLKGGQATLNVQVTVIAYIVFALASWLFSVVLFIFVAKLTARFIRDLRIDAYAAVIENNVPFFDDQNPEI